MENYILEQKKISEQWSETNLEDYFKEKYDIEKIYPTTKLLFAFVLCVATFLIPVEGMGYFIFLINIFFAAISKKFSSFVSLAFKTLVPIVVLMFLFQLFIVNGSHILFSIGPLDATKEGLDSGITFSSNIAGIASSIMLFFQVTHTRSIIKAMENSNLQKNAIFVVSSTLLFVPESSKLSKTIMQAQQSRGVETEGSLLMRIKSFVPMISPLVLSTISNNEEKVLTLESRGYSSKAKRTVLFPISKSKKDKVLGYILWAILILLIIGRLFIWR